MNMIPIPPISGYAKLAAGGMALVLLAGLCWKSYTAGQADIQADWDADRVSRSMAQVKAVDNRIVENEALRAQYAAQHQQEVARYEKELAFNRAIEQRNAGRRVPISAAICGSGSAGSAQAAGAGSAEQDPAGTWLLPERFTNDLRQLAARADEVVADARAVQSAIKSSECF